MTSPVSPAPATTVSYLLSGSKGSEVNCVLRSNQIDVIAKPPRLPVMFALLGAICNGSVMDPALSAADLLSILSLSGFKSMVRRSPAAMENVNDKQQEKS
ncbi:hypothetical protein ARTHROSP310_32090 [Arthrobacter sp. AD-310]